MALNLTPGPALLAPRPRRPAPCRITAPEKQNPGTGLLPPLVNIIRPEIF